MKNSKVWAIAFFILLIVNIGAILSINISNKSKNIRTLEFEKTELKTNYINNAKELKYLLETLLNNSSKLKKYMPEYSNKSDKEFEEALRKKVIKLDLKIEELESK
jgi:hypothetical protein